MAVAVYSGPVTGKGTITALATIIIIWNNGYKSCVTVLTNKCHCVYYYYYYYLVTSAVLAVAAQGQVQNNCQHATLFLREAAKANACVPYSWISRGLS